MLEFLNAVGSGLPGRLMALLFFGGLFTILVSGVVAAATDEEYGEGGLVAGVFMFVTCVFLLALWVVLRAGYWVVTGV